MTSPPITDLVQATATVPGQTRVLHTALRHPMPPLGVERRFFFLPGGLERRRPGFRGRCMKPLSKKPGCNRAHASNLFLKTSVPRPQNYGAERTRCRTNGTGNRRSEPKCRSL